MQDIIEKFIYLSKFNRLYVFV